MKPIPTINEIQGNIISDLKSKLNISDLEAKMVLDAFGSVMAGQFKLMYIYLGDILNNIFPDTADTIENGGELNRLGDIYLNRQPKPATNGYYLVELTSSEDSFLRNGITYKSNEDSTSAGKLFVSEINYTANGLNDSIIIRSLESGKDSLLKINDQLTITEPVIGTESTVTVLEVITLPISSESIEDYRKKILDAIRLEPQGGARTDYRLWSQDAQGVKQVYPYVKDSEPGTVQVFVEATSEDSIDENGTPSQTILNLVEEVIYFSPDLSLTTNERGRLPIQVNLEVLPIILKPVDIKIINLQSVTQSIKDNVKRNLLNYLKDVRPFISGCDLLSEKNNILYSGKLQAVVLDSLSSNNFYDDFEVFVDGQLENNFTFDGANIPYLRNINYV